LISATFGAVLINTSEVSNRETKWPHFLAHPVEKTVLKQNAETPTKTQGTVTQKNY